jgi:HK97 family phage major capsid protein
MNEKELREKHKALIAEADAVVAKAEGENRGMTAEEFGQVEAKLAEAKTVADQLAAIDKQRDLRSQIDKAKAYVVPETQRTVTDAPQRPTIEVGLRQEEKYETGDALGALVSARMRFGAWAQRDAQEWARKTYGEGSRQFRAMQQSVFTAGGATIAENFVGQELIELLRAKAAVRLAGARSLPLVNGSATIPKVTGGASANWVGSEGDNITPSELTTGAVKLVEKKLAVLVPISNDLRKNTSLAMERVVRDDMVRAAANTEDIAFLKGDGTQGSPKGIYYWVGAAGRGNSAGTSLANVRSDIRTALNRLGNANAPEEVRAWFMHSRSKNYMGWDLVDGNSNFAFPELRTGNRLADAPVFKDNNIAINLGAGANASEIYYAEMTECFIGDSGEMELEIFENATYVDAGGNLRSGVSRDESVIRLIRKSDFGMRHVESAFVLEAVTYGG